MGERGDDAPHTRRGWRGVGGLENRQGPLHVGSRRRTRSEEAALSVERVERPTRRCDGRVGVELVKAMEQVGPGGGCVEGRSHRITVI